MTIKAKNKEYRILGAFLECRDALVCSILKISARKENVEGILQETYLRAYTENEKKTIMSPKDYLFVISRNLVLKRLRKISKEINSEICDVLHDVDQETAATKFDVHHKLTLEAFIEALSELPENSRQAILMRKIYGMSHKEIAGKLGVSVSSVEKYISKGIKSCAETLSERDYTNEVP